MVECERPRIAAWQVGAPGCPDEQHIAGKYLILDAQAHGIAGVVRSVKRLQPQPADGQLFTAL
jgi:hypothetical protein